MSKNKQPRRHAPLVIIDHRTGKPYVPKKKPTTQKIKLK